MKIAVLASGSGSNLQALIDACESGLIPDSSINVVISNKEEAFALTRAERHSIEQIFLPTPEGMKKYRRGMDIKDIMNDPIRRDYDRQIAENASKRGIDVICLAGYMLFITPVLLDQFNVINIHPAILPSFKGMHGVQDALDYGVKIIGCTTHFVDTKEDHGPIILQAFTPVFSEDTVEDLVERNLKREHIIYPETLRLYKNGLLNVNGRSVFMTWDQQHSEYQRTLVKLWMKDIQNYHMEST